jgi:hypothetical protein
MAVSAAAHPWSPPSRLAFCSQGWKKPGFLYKKNQPSGFLGFLVFFGFFGFFFFFLFFYTGIFSQKREFLGFFQFQEHF